MRVMKCLSRVLNVSLHVRKPTGVKQETRLSVTGPLTWRQFQRMAGWESLALQRCRTIFINIGSFFLKCF